MPDTIAHIPWSLNDHRKVTRKRHAGKTNKVTRNSRLSLVHIFSRNDTPTIFQQHEHQCHLRIYSCPLAGSKVVRPKKKKHVLGTPIQMKARYKLAPLVVEDISEMFT